MRSLPGSPGLGLRLPHIPEVLQSRPDVAWFELLADNHLPLNSLAYRQACVVSESYPVSLHCVNMNLGGEQPLDQSYLKQLKCLQVDTQAICISDHACFTSGSGSYSHDLLPLPFTEEAVRYLSNRIRRVQDILQQPILLENVSSYIRPEYESMTESEFLLEVASQSSCRLLVDVNNYFVSEINFGVDAWQELNKIPLHLIAQVHIAGHEKTDWGVLDTHGELVDDAVWQLLNKLFVKHGSLPTMIERDNNLGALSALLQEYDQLKECYTAVPNKKVEKSPAGSSVCTNVVLSAGGSGSWLKAGA